MLFAVLIMWHEQSDHVTDYYFCMKSIRRCSRKNKSEISYLVFKSAINPVPHDPDLPVLQPPTEKEDILSVDERASTGTKSEKDLIKSGSFFQHDSAALFINQNARMSWCVICIYPKRKQTFWGPGFNSGIYENQEQPFRPFVTAIKPLMVLVYTLKIF